LKWIKADKSGPFRVVGLQQCFIGDYSAVYGLEDIRSCAPLSNGEFISLVRNFPGMELSEDWKIKVVKLAQAQPLLNMLNVKYLLTLPDVTTRVNLDFAKLPTAAILASWKIWRSGRGRFLRTKSPPLTPTNNSSNSFLKTADSPSSQ
jgi:hypothetical protein